MMFSQPGLIRLIRSILTSTVLVGMPLSISGQTKTDSLISVIENRPNSLEAAQCMNTLSWELIHSDTLSAHRYAQRALDLAIRLKNRNEEALAYNRLGRLAHVSGRFGEALNWYHKNLRIRWDTEDTLGACHTLTNIGNVYKNQGDHVAAVENYLSALSFLTVIRTSDASLEAIVYNNLGSAYTRLDRSDLALDYYEKSLEIRRHTGDSLDYASACLNLGSFLTRIGEWERAFGYYSTAEQIQQKFNDLDGLAKTKTNLGNLHFEKEEYVQAIGQYRIAYRNQHSLGNRTEMIRLMNNLGSSYSMLGNEDEARSYYLRGLDLAREIESKEQQALFFENLAYSEESSGNYREALGWYYKYDSISSLLLNEENVSQVNELQARYDLLKKESDLERMEKEQARQALLINRKETQLRTTGIIIVFLFIIGVVSLIGYRQKQKAARLLKYQKQILAEREKEKEVLLKELNHRVKNNLQIISSMLSLQSVQLKDQIAQKAIKEGQGRIEAMSLVHQKLYQTNTVTHIDMREYVEKLILSIAFSHGYDESDFQLNQEVQVEFMEADLAIPAGLIINELINNSFKHAFEHTEHPEIAIRIVRSDEKYFIALKDNGPGFDGHAPGEKKSFGYELIQALIKQLKGEYTIKSENGFYIDIEFPAIEA